MSSQAGSSSESTAVSSSSSRGNSAAVSYQQDALRRLTCHRTAASLISSGVAGRRASTTLAGPINRPLCRTASASMATQPTIHFNNQEGPAVNEQQPDEEQQSRSMSVHRDTPTVTTKRNNDSHRSHRSHRSHQPTSSNTSCVKEGWTVVRTDPLSPGRPPCQRSLHAAAVLRDSLYVFGGYDGQNRVNDFYQYHFPTDTWREIVTLGAPIVAGVPLPPSPTHQQPPHQQQQSHPHHSGNADMGGGANHPLVEPTSRMNRGPDNNLSSRHRMVGATIAVTGSVPSPRDRHAAVVHNSTFYIFGGFDGTRRVSDLYGFDVDRLIWREIRPRAGPTNSNTNNANTVAAAGLPSLGGGTVWRPGLNSTVDAGGGVGGIPPNVGGWHQPLPQRGEYLAVGGELDDRTELIEEHPRRQQQQQQQQNAVVERQNHSPPSPRHSHAAVVHNDCMYVFGGYDGSYRSDFHEFDFIQCTWSPVFGSGRSPRARYRSAACVHDDTMILFGGHDGTRHLSDVHTFDFVTQVWSLLMTDGIPPLPRDSHISVVYKDSMYVFGGSTGSAMSDLHELILPSTSKEVMTDVSSAPDYATVTGSTSFPSQEEPEEIMEAEWRQIPPVPGGGIPVHRFCHVGAVYGGSLYVFGGYDGSSRLNDFIKYDLSMDDLFETDIPPPTLLSDLRSFLEDEGAMSLSDITLMVEGIPVRAHKLMLMRCPYFRAMLLSDMVESSQSTVHLEIVRHSIFLSVLEYLYTDDVAIPLDSAMELFVAADLFGIPRLQAMCERKLLECITVENAATIFHAADVHSAHSLRSKALGYVLSHFEVVSKTLAFEDMARCNVELVFEILKNR